MTGVVIDVGSLSRVIANLNREIVAEKQRTHEGVGQACLLVQSRAQGHTPVRYGVLRSSAGSMVEDGSTGPMGTVYYTADYAPFVHENLEAHHNVGEAKFLEKAVVESHDDILAIIGRTARVA